MSMEPMAGAQAGREDLAIELVDLKKVFSGNTVVDSVGLGIRKGEFFSLLGPSGCGKTTTLRMIAGLETPTSGRILLAGQDVTGVPPYRRDVNTVFQDYAIFPHMDVAENVYYPLRMRRIPRRAAGAKIDEVLRLVNMLEYKHRFSSQLSGGQRQRVALARALVNEPKALLLDEPLGALDFKLRVAMQTALKDLQTKLNISFVYVTHDQTEAITMSDRIAVMKGGVVHQVGTPDEIYNHPRTAFVASFIGEMNFFDGEVVGVEPDGIVARVADRQVCCRRGEQAFSPGQGVVIAIRPEKVYLNPSRRLRNELETTVRRVIFRGSDYDVSSLLGGSELRAVSECRGWDRSLGVGSPIRVGWEAEDAIVFPRAMKQDIISY